MGQKSLSTYHTQFSRLVSFNDNVPGWKRVVRQQPYACCSIARLRIGSSTYYSCPHFRSGVSSICSKRPQALTLIKFWWDITSDQESWTHLYNNIILGLHYKHDQYSINAQYAYYNSNTHTHLPSPEVTLHVSVIIRNCLQLQIVGHQSVYTKKMIEKWSPLHHCSG